jgi:hypothetical protein
MVLMVIKFGKSNFYCWSSVMRYMQRVTETLQKDRRRKWRLLRLVSGIAQLNSVDVHELGTKNVKLSFSTP